MPDDRTTILLAAMPMEMMPVVRRLDLTRGKRGQYRGSFGDQTLIAQITGIGAVRAAAALDQVLSEYSPQRIIHFGLAGGLDPALKLGAMVRAAHVIDEHGHTINLADPQADGVLLTVDEPITSATEKARLHRESRADAVEMETFAVAARLAEHPASLIALRAISDPADEVLPAAIGRALRADGSVNPLGVAGMLLSRPLDIFTLLKLHRDGSRVAQQLAEAVADLIAEDQGIESATAGPGLPETVG